MVKQIQTPQRSFQTFKCSPGLHKSRSCAQPWSGAARLAVGHQLLQRRQYSLLVSESFINNNYRKFCNDILEAKP